MEPGLVSTIIPVHNRAAMLRDAVASVLAQTYRPIEILVIDDGSTDDTPATADALAAAHAEIRVIHQPNRGVGLAREAGRLAARGEFIQYLDSDDLLYPEKFALQVQGLQEHPECGVSYGWTLIRLPDGTLRPDESRRTTEKIGAMFPAMLQSRWWHTNTPLYRASVVDAAGPWSALQQEEDWEYDARVAALGIRLHYVPEWIAEFRHHHAGRLSLRGMDPDALRDRARAHERILRHAQHAEIQRESAEMRHFARELFFLARQCGAAGLAEESRMLFRLAREASEPRANRLQFATYGVVVHLLGWTLTGKLSMLADRWRT